MDTKAEIIKLLASLRHGTVSPSAYDTAWVARLKDQNGNLLYPQALDWVINNQNDDGSWGDGVVDQPFDKTISTVNCIITLKICKKAEDLANRGVEYLNRNLDRVLDEEERLTVGFEVLFPELLEQLKSFGINIQNKKVEEHFQTLRAKKIERLPLEFLYKKKTVYNYSLEFLASVDADFEKISQHIEENGSYGSSPSSTAFMYMQRPQKASLEYFDNIIQELGYIVDFFPFEEFERAWIINYIIQLGLVEEFKDQVSPHVEYLKQSWSDSGVAFSKFFGVADLDITSSIFKILRYFGNNLTLNVFKNFETEEGFYCYFGESESSISHIANMIDSLEISEQPAEETERNRLTKKATDFAKSHLLERLSDKWNTSKYYTYSRIPFYNKNGFEDFTTSAFKSITESQNGNGSWGKSGGDPEETSWAVIALLKINEGNTAVSDKSLVKAYEYLLANNINAPMRSNWISKVLYCPINIRNALILLTLYKLQNLYG